MPRIAPSGVLPEDLAGIGAARGPPRSAGAWSSRLPFGAAHREPFARRSTAEGDVAKERDAAPVHGEPRRPRTSSALTATPCHDHDAAIVPGSGLHHRARADQHRRVGGAALPLFETRASMRTRVARSRKVPLRRHRHGVAAVERESATEAPSADAAHRRKCARANRLLERAKLTKRRCRVLAIFGRRSPALTADHRSRRLCSGCSGRRARRALATAGRSAAVQAFPRAFEVSLSLRALPSRRRSRAAPAPPAVPSSRSPISARVSELHGPPRQASASAFCVLGIDHERVLHDLESGGRERRRALCAGVHEDIGIVGRRILARLPG